MVNESGKGNGPQVPHGDAIPLQVGLGGERVVSIGAAVGENVRHIRVQRGVTQAEFARMLGTLGGGWTKARVFSLEGGGRDSVTLTELVELSIVLRAPVDTLLRGEGNVRITDRCVIGRNDVAEALRHGSVPEWTLNDPDLENIFDPAAVEIAERLGWGDAEGVVSVRETARALFGQTVTQERDARVGGGADSDSAYRRRNFMQQIENEIRESNEQ